MKVWIALILAILTSTQCVAQTCCTAGAPISAGLGFSSSNDYRFNLSFRFESRSINRLIDRNTVLENDPRNRAGINSLLRLTYRANKRLSLGVALPFIYQTRSTISETQSSLGLGDMRLAALLNIVAKRKTTFSYIGAVKIPTGQVSHRDQRGILLSPDMQSGTGTFDFSQELFLSISNIFDRPYKIETGVLWRFNTTNWDFGGSQSTSGRSFKFGNEIQYSFSLSRDFLLKNWILVPDIGFQFRKAQANEEQNLNASNSGGNWWNARVGLYVLPKEKFSVRSFMVLPMYQSLEGLQITTSFEWGIELAYRFGASDKIKMDKNVFE